MARLIKDSVVNKRCEELGYDRMFIDNKQTYQGNVSTIHQKTKLDLSEFGLSTVSIISPIKATYSSLNIKDDDCCIIINGTKFSATNSQVRLIKALIIEQVNRNEDYSMAVALCAMQLIQQVVSKDLTCIFTPDADSTDMQKIVMEQLSKLAYAELLSN